MSFENLLTVKEVAKEIGVAAVTVRKWCRSGKVFPNARKARLGVTTWVVPRSDIDGWEQRRPSPGRPPGGKRKDGKMLSVVSDDGRVIGSYTTTKIGIKQCGIATREAVRYLGDGTVKVLLDGVDVTWKFLGDDNGKDA